MKSIIGGVIVGITLSAPVFGFEANDRLAAVMELDNKEFTEVQGHLKRSWMWDESDPSFVVTVGLVTYDVELDDGRGTTKRAMQCPQQEIFGNPNEGCSISFDGIYHTEISNNIVEVDLTIWNVEFID
ncbi:hypothetical protein [Actibacterium pelagium]|uniref:Uncharacterized protein n=1 Tax=Actibacterium pelagium TaxID=2029103 RepID=A0A917EIR0_9RHOB|nr:hypothetical protein [Actibacterium pelagium]GGE41360.1 hypothetical protein GCM10011517_06190 [Actibacterium pelagium]